MNAKYALFAILLTCISCTLGCNRADLRLLETERKGLKVFEEFRSQPQSLQAIQDRSKLRAITYFNAMGYFISEANEKGFDYSLASEFAEWLGVELEIVIPPSRAAAADWLHDG